MRDCSTVLFFFFLELSRYHAVSLHACVLYSGAWYISRCWFENRKIDFLYSFLWTALLSYRRFCLQFTQLLLLSHCYLYSGKQVSKSKLGLQELIKMVGEYYVQYLFSFLVCCSVIVMLTCAPFGFILLFDMVGKLLVKPKILENNNSELITATRYEEVRNLLFASIAHWFSMLLQVQ